MSHAWMPFYIGDYLADTGHLTTLEHGAYLMLIMHYWQKGCLPADEKLIARVARLTPEQWAESRDILAMLFGDGWTHKRIDAELAKAAEIVGKRKTAAETGHQRRRSSANAVHVQSTSTDTGASTFHQVPSSEAIASDAVASKADPRDELWTEGLASLIAMTGMPDRKARGVLGKWCRDARDDCSLVLAKIRAAKAERIGEAVAWITRAIKPLDDPPKPFIKPNGVTAALGRMKERERNERQNAIGDEDAQRIPADNGQLRLIAGHISAAARGPV
mgnify:FL=1